MARNHAWAIVAALLLGGCAGDPQYRPGAVRRAAAAAAALDPPRQDERDFWRVEPGVRLFHFSDGQGRPAIVVHGGPGIPPYAAWEGLHRVEGVAFHYFHQRGCGKSTRPFDAFAGGSFSGNARLLEATLGLGAQVADVERVRRILGQDRVVVVGHSFGGLIAALYAAEFPEHVSALVLESPADLLVAPSPAGGAFAQVEARLPPPRRAEFRAWLGRYLDFPRLFDRTEAELARLHEEFGGFYLEAMSAGATAAAEPVHAGPAPRGPVPGQVGGFMPQAVYLSMGRSHDWRAAMAAVRAPVLVLHGERDLQPLAATQAFAAAFPSAELRVIAGATHFAHAEQPDAFAREVRAFLTARAP